MARPLTRAQQLENAAFLKALTRSGNARGAAREVGLAYGTMRHRRAKHAGFAQLWDAAVVAADARLNRAGGLRRPCRAGPSTTELRSAVPLPETSSGRNEKECTSTTFPVGRNEKGHRTVGGETVVVRRRDGKFQVRSAQPGKLTRECEQAFFAALSATANVRLSAAAAGASEAAFYRRRRQNPAFAREMRLALQTGYDRIELALLESFKLASHADDAWRHNDPPPIPSMTPAQALQLLYLHQKEARLQAEPAHLRRRRGESSDARSYRLATMYEAGLERDREAFDLAEAGRLDRGEPAPLEPPPPMLPALDQVTGWSKAGQGKVHDPDVALFGGWRLEHMEARKRTPKRGG